MSITCRLTRVSKHRYHSMKTINVLFLLLFVFFLLAKTNASSSTVICSTNRIEARDTKFVQFRNESDGLGNVRYFTFLQLPWHVVPDITISVPNGGSNTNVRLADIHEPWIDDMLVGHETLFEFQLPKLELGAASSLPSTGCNDKTGDMFYLSWYDTTYARHFSAYPMLCHYTLPQQFGVDSKSFNTWGDSPRAVRTGEVFGVRDSRESMELIVLRTNQAQVGVVPLSLRFSSGRTDYPLIALTYRTCVVADIDAIRATALHYLSTASDPIVAAVAAVNAAALEPVQELADTRPTLWPIRECVEQESSGTCVARFGYVLTGSNTPIDVPIDSTHNNYFEPQDVAARIKNIPTHFEPGIHRSVFKVRWFCLGKTLNSWNTISWTLMGSRATITKNVDRCGDTTTASERQALEQVRQHQPRNLLSLDDEKKILERPIVDVSSPIVPRMSYLTLGLGCERHEVIAGQPSSEINPRIVWKLRALPEVSVRLSNCPIGELVRIELHIEAETMTSKTTAKVLTERVTVRCMHQIDAHGHVVAQPLLSFALDPLANPLTTPEWPLIGAFPIDGQVYRPNTWHSEIELPKNAYRLVVSAFALSTKIKVLDTETAIALCQQEVPTAKRQLRDDTPHTTHDVDESTPHPTIDDDDDEETDNHLDCGDDVEGCGQGHGCSGDKVKVCHKKNHTICIDQDALDGHLRHGDYLGMCNGTKHPCGHDQVAICYHGQDICVCEKDLTAYLGMGATLGSCGNGSTSISTTTAAASTTRAATTTGAATTASVASTTAAATTTGAATTTAAASTTGAATTASAATTTAATYAATTTAASTTSIASTTLAATSSSTSGSSTTGSTTGSGSTTPSVTVSPTSTPPSTTTTPPPTTPYPTTTNPPSTTTIPPSTTTVPPTTTIPPPTTTHPPHTTRPPHTTHPPTTRPPHTTKPPCSKECEEDGDRCRIVPFVQCTRNFENGTCQTIFGYTNEEGDDIVFRAPGVSSGNYIVPSPSVRSGQPSVFLPGTHFDAFVLNWPCSHSNQLPIETLSWVLNGTATASSAVRNTCDNDDNDDDECGDNVDTATLQLFGDRQFTQLFTPGNPWHPSIIEGDRTFALLTLDLSVEELDDWCLEINKVQMCSFEDPLEMAPFDPRHPDITGCNTPDVTPTFIVLLYNRASNFTNSAYKFMLLSNPSPKCLSKAAFSWIQRVFTQQPVVLQVDWNATCANDGTDPLGSSAISFDTACPGSHFFSDDRQCCVRVQPININIWNSNNNNNNANSDNTNVNDNSNADSQHQDQEQSQTQNNNQTDNDDNDDHTTTGEGDRDRHHHRRKGEDDDWDVWAIVWFWILVFIILAFLLCLCCACWYETDHVHETYVEPPPPPTTIHQHTTAVAERTVVRRKPPPQIVIM